MGSAPNAYIIFIKIESCTTNKYSVVTRGANGDKRQTYYLNSIKTNFPLSLILPNFLINKNFQRSLNGAI